MDNVIYLPILEYYTYIAHNALLYVNEIYDEFMEHQIVFYKCYDEVSLYHLAETTCEKIYYIKYNDPITDEIIYLAVTETDFLTLKEMAKSKYFNIMGELLPDKFTLKKITISNIEKLVTILKNANKIKIQSKIIPNTYYFIVKADNTIFLVIKYLNNFAIEMFEKELEPEIFKEIFKIYISINDLNIFLHYIERIMKYYKNEPEILKFIMEQCFEHKYFSKIMFILKKMVKEYNINIKLIDLVTLDNNDIICYVEIENMVCKFNLYITNITDIDTINIPSKILPANPLFCKVLNNIVITSIPYFKLRNHNNLYNFEFKIDLKYFVM